VRLLRIVPDDTKFDFMRFRRISFPLSAILSIIAISLYFFHGLNFGIDFKGGTLMEVQSKAGAADLARMRATLGSLGLGEVQLRSSKLSARYALHWETKLSIAGWKWSDPAYQANSCPTASSA
jgi:preprotein translocase subunit SecF